MNKKLIIFLLVGIIFMLSSCQYLKETAKKISENRAETTVAEVSEEITSIEESTTKEQETTTITTQTSTSITTTTSTQKKEEEIVEELEFEDGEFKDDILLPQINLSMLDLDDAKLFNEEILELSKKLIESKNDSEKVGANFEYFDSEDILSIKVNISGVKEDNESQNSYFTKTIVIDKNEKKALNNKEVLKLLDADKDKFSNIFSQFVRGYLYKQEETSKEVDKINQAAKTAIVFLNEHIISKENPSPIYFDGDLIITVPIVDVGNKGYKYLDLVYAETYEDFVNKNEFGAFSKYNVKEDLKNPPSLELDLSINEKTNDLLVSFNKSGAFELDKMKYDYSSEDVLLESAEYGGEVKKGDKILIKMDLIQKRKSNSKRNEDEISFYRLVLRDGDKYYVMDLNYFDDFYKEIDLEYALNPTLDYKKKIEQANSKIKNAVNLLGVPMARINQLYGYEYKLKPIGDDYYEMVFEDERYPVLRFDGKDASSTVQRVFSDFSGYNIIDEINVGMTVNEVFEIQGGYKNKVISGEQIYESYTVFNIDKYDVYVYGKDSDLISFGIAIEYEDK